MLKKRFIMPLMVCTAIIPCASASLVGCNQEGHLPDIKKHETKDCPVYVLQGENENLQYVKSTEIKDIKVHLFNDSVIPYMSIKDYVDWQMQYGDERGQDYTNYSCEVVGETLVITNIFNEHTLTINFRSQTITYSDLDWFWCNWKNAVNPFEAAAICDSDAGEVYFSKLENISYVGKSYTVDLGKYNLTGYFDGREGYLPFDLFAILIATEISVPLFYNGVNFYELSGSKLACYNNKSVELTSALKNDAILTKEYMEYTYNLMAVYFDVRYGLHDRPLRTAQPQHHKFFEGGAYATLAEYKDRITSLEPNVSSKAIRDVMFNEVDDGAHSGFKSLNVLATEVIEKSTIDGPEAKNTKTLLHEKLPVARNNSSIDQDSKNGTSYFEYTQNDSTIAYITFDEFMPPVDKSTWSDEEKAAGRILPEYTTEANYKDDTLRLITYSNKMIQDHISKHEDIKVVIDLSCNGGGAGDVEHFIASWICGGMDGMMWNKNTGAFGKYHCEADLDGDKDFDTYDYLPSDLDLYCITSNGTFSAGNMLACDIASRPGAKFIGDWSGGGACSVNDNISIGLGTVLRSSSCHHILKKGSTPDNIISVEEGVMPEFYYIKNIDENLYKFFDRATINNKIWGNI